MCGEEKVKVAHFELFSVFLVGGGVVILCCICCRAQLCGQTLEWLTDGGWRLALRASLGPQLKLWLSWLGRKLDC